MKCRAAPRNDSCSAVIIMSTSIEPVTMQTLGPQPTGKHLVLIDDDEGLLEVMSKWFKLAGFQVTRFNQFTDAKRYLSGAHADVVITDVRLGAYNGLQLAILAKLEDPSIVAIVLTGFDDPVMRKEAENAGVEFLVKPVSGEQLLSHIRQ